MADRLVALIQETLKAGSIPTVIIFGIDTFPEPPYVCIKPEVGVVDNTRNYKVIAHVAPEFVSGLENYVLIELDSLLLGTLTDADGSQYRLRPAGYDDIRSALDDSTYFMARNYFTPMLLR